MLERMRRWIVGGLVAAYLAALVGLTLTPIGWRLNRLTVRLYVFGLHDLGLSPRILPEHYGYLLNVGLFVPLGVLLVLVLRRSWPMAVLLATAVSATVELVQATPWLDRQVSFGDVVSNVLGAVLGAALGRHVARSQDCRERADARLG